MINFSFHIGNPWAKSNFKNLWNKSVMLTKHKAAELEFVRHNYALFDFGVQVTGKQDHSGLTLEFALLGFCVHFNVYDVRHWDDENDDWHNHE